MSRLFVPLDAGMESAHRRPRPEPRRHRGHRGHRGHSQPRRGGERRVPRPEGRSPKPGKGPATARMKRNSRRTGFWGWRGQSNWLLPPVPKSATVSPHWRYQSIFHPQVGVDTASNAAGTLSAVSAFARFSARIAFHTFHSAAVISRVLWYGTCWPTSRHR